MLETNSFEYTIKEVAESLNMSKERCRQVLLVALKKLKHEKYKANFNDISEIINEIEKSNNDEK